MRALPWGFILAASIYSSGAHAASPAADKKAYAVADSLFSFERPVVRDGKVLERKRMTHGMKDASVKPETLLGYMLGKGQMSFRTSGKGKSVVRWHVEAPDSSRKDRELGTLTEVGDELVFHPTIKLRRDRNAYLGGWLVSGVESVAARPPRITAGTQTWATWKDKLKQAEFTLPGGGWRRSFGEVSESPIGDRTEFSDAIGSDVVDQIAARNVALARALRPIAGGGVSVTYTQASAEGPDRAVGRVTLFPKHKGTRPSVESSFSGTSQGGAIIDWEHPPAGQNPIRAMSRHDMKANRGFVKDQQARFASLLKSDPQKANLERRIAAAFVAGREPSTIETSALRDTPPNELLHHALGRGRIVIGEPDASGGRSITFVAQRESGDAPHAAIELGHMAPSGTIQVTGQATQKRDQLIGNLVIPKLFSTQRYQNTGRALFARYLTSRSDETLPVVYGAGRIANSPMKAEFTISEPNNAGVRFAMYRALPSAMQEAVNERLASPISMSWKSQSIPMSFDDGKPGRWVRVPAGHHVEHSLSTLGPRDGASNEVNGARTVTYRYSIVRD